MKTLRDMIVLLILGIVSSYCVKTLYQLHSAKSGESLSQLASLPEPIARAMSLEFPGVASDFLMLKATTHLGEKLMNNERLTKHEWQTVYLTLKQVVNLDDRFFDPYLVAQTTLPFEAGMVQETNTLLEKAAKILVADYRPHFFLWYNYFYFLNDSATAATHLEKAARIPGAPEYFATLAARTNLYAGKLYAAVVYLEETLKDTTDPSIRKFLSMRLDALKRMGFLELKIEEFRKRYHRTPEKLQELIDCGLISKIPQDPYGGEFYIMEGGRVYSTSKLVQVPSNTNNK